MISEKYSSKEIYVQSTDYDRTIMSAQANLAGLYPPVKDDIWLESINWQPIPVHTIPPKDDYALYGPDDCPEFFNEYEKYENESPEVKLIYHDYKDLFTFWSEMIGKNLTTIDDIAPLHRTLEIEFQQGKP